MCDCAIYTGVSFLRLIHGGPKHNSYNFVFFAIRSFVSDIWAKHEQINAKNYLCRNTGCRYVLSPLAARSKTPPGISWAYGEICVLLTQ